MKNPSLNRAQLINIVADNICRDLSKITFTDELSIAHQVSRMSNQPTRYNYATRNAVIQMRVAYGS
jgi:hypothetical protein